MTIVTIILGVQLVAAVAWTADTAHSGPGVTIIQLSQDADTNWAVMDLKDRLSKFITDDPFFPDRVMVEKTSDPHVAETINDKIIIYVSHGGPLGIVTGRRLTSWSRMARIVEDSHAALHLFAACSSKNIIRHGADDSEKRLYTVPGARPAEVTNVEIASTVMLAFGLDPDYVSEYRTAELTHAKELIQSGQSVHIMDFEQIILNEIENIDGNYSDTYTSDFKVYREAVELTYTSTGDLSKLPADLKDEILYYYRSFFGSDGVDSVRTLIELEIVYVKNYYINSTYFTEEGGESQSMYLDDAQTYQDSMYSEVYSSALLLSGGYWVNSTSVFTGGTYSGWVVYSSESHWMGQVLVNVTASGPSLDANNKTVVDSISLNQNCAGGTYVQLQKIDGEWQEPVVGRNPGRTGGSWTDAATKADYEYEEDWPPVSDYTESAGALNATDGYLFVNSVSTGTCWHGPSFARTLPSYFRTSDLGAFSANLTLLHGNDGYRMVTSCVGLYDVNNKPVAILKLADEWGATAGSADQKARFSATYYLANGTGVGLTSSVISGDTSGIVQVRFDPHKGVFGDVPGKNETMLFKWTDIDSERIIKYVTVQGYRYGSNQMHNTRIYSIHVNYAASEYTVFHDSCNDMDEFHKDLDFGYGLVADGNFTVPAGESYMTPTDIANTPTGWHGPCYVHVLDRPFRLSQLSEFSVNGELVQSANNQMGQIRAALFDEDKNIVMLILWKDSWAGTMKAKFTVYYYLQNGSLSAQGTDYIYSSFRKTGKLWWSSYPGEEGSIYSSIEGEDGVTLLGQCDNASRVIKYVVLLGYRSGGYPLGDVRVHDIYVEADMKWNQRAVVLNDDCSDVDNFESDPDFGWGEITAGNLTVPSGESYITPSDIPDSPTGWHGPNFVHEFETTFILNNLWNFYVQAELVQQSFRSGMMEVALFDVDKKLVMKVMWGDSWASYNKGYFHTVYYPEGGSSSGDGMDYVYTSFFRIGSMKVEDGHVKYEIKEGGDTLASGDLGEVANPARKIKYLVIRPSRASGYDLIDLRLHGISVFAGQDTSLEEPEKKDGTHYSNINSISESHQQDTDEMMYEASESVNTYWSGPWPVLHISVDKVLSSNITIMVIVGVDLLGSADIEDVSFEMDGFEDLSETETNEFIALAGEEISTNTFWNDAVQYQLVALWGALFILELLAAMPVVLSTMIVTTACLITMLLFVILMWSIVFAVRQMQMSNREAGWTFLFAALSVLGFGAVSAFFLHISDLGFRKALGYFSGGWTRSNSLKGYQGRANVIIFVTMMILLFICFLTFYGMTQQWW